MNAISDPMWKYKVGRIKNPETGVWELPDSDPPIESHISHLLPVGRIYDLLEEVSGPYTPEYQAKMLHKVPDAPVLPREEYLLKAAKGKVVLDIGASGPMAKALGKVTKQYHGIDKVNNSPDHYQPYIIDIDQATALPDFVELDLIIAGEVIEHLSNAGHFLDLIHPYNVPVILTTPNAFSTNGSHHLKNGIENVNKEHVAWYSYHTLKTLIERHSFKLLLWAWYNGKPLTAEGLIFHMEPDYGKD